MEDGLGFLAPVWAGDLSSFGVWFGGMGRWAQLRLCNRVSADGEGLQAVTHYL
jgi:hypothetical protein